MMHDPSLADLLFIALICGLIGAIMSLISRSRRRRSNGGGAEPESQTDQEDRPS